MVTPSPSGHSISWLNQNSDVNNENNNEKMNFQFKDLPPQIKTTVYVIHRKMPSLLIIYMSASHL